MVFLQDKVDKGDAHVVADANPSQLVRISNIELVRISRWRRVGTCGVRRYRVGMSAGAPMPAEAFAVLGNGGGFSIHW